MLKDGSSMSSSETRTTGIPDRFAPRALLFDHIQDGVSVTTPEGILADWNPGATRMFGWKSGEVVGQPMSLLYGATGESLVSEVLRRLTAQRILV